MTNGPGGGETPPASTKPFKSFDEMVSILRDRNLDFGVGGSAGLRDALSSIGYHRLAGYWRYHQIDPASGQNQFRAGTTLDAILDDYEKDAILRMLLLEALGVIEVALRAGLAHWFAADGHTYAYLESALYRTQSDGRAGLSSAEAEASVRKFVEQMREGIAESKLPAVLHHRRRGLPVPVWAAVEVASFGQLSKMYGLQISTARQKLIAKRFGIRSVAVAASTFHALAVLRNICAHHGRLWNRTLDIQLMLPTQLADKVRREATNSSPWAAIELVKALALEIDPHSVIPRMIEDHLSSSSRFDTGLRLPVGN